MNNILRQPGYFFFKLNRQYFFMIPVYIVNLFHNTKELFSFSKKTFEDLSDKSSACKRKCWYLLI